MSSADSRRLFLALWPEEEHRLAMASMAQAAAGRRAVKSDNLHLTLVFLGSTDADRLACYERALSDLEVMPLTLTLDRFGYWPRPRVLWLGASHPPLNLIALVLDLNRRLESCGFTPERRPYSPHITLARKFPGPAPKQPPAEPLIWAADHIVLAESVREEDGTRYRVLRRWPESQGDMPGGILRG